jgi:hypothetical protein
MQAIGADGHCDEAIQVSHLTRAHFWIASCHALLAATAVVFAMTSTEDDI